MKFAIFDLDHTLLPVDSGDGWSRWLVKSAGLHAEHLDAEITAYAQAYRRGDFSVDDFMSFQMGLLAQCRRDDLEAWRTAFVDAVVRPNVRSEALTLVADRRAAGFEPVLASGTHQFVTRAIAPLFGIKHVVGALPETDNDGEFTGRVKGLHSYQEGKRLLVEQFLTDMMRVRGEDVTAIEAFSDSINDLPLLAYAAEHGTAYAVNPDDRLREEAMRRRWPVMDIFNKVRAQDV